MRDALQFFAIWLAGVAVFMIFWVLLKSGAGDPEDDGPDVRQGGPPPGSGA